MPIAYIHGHKSHYDPNGIKVKTLQKIDDVIPVDYNSTESYSSCMSKLRGIIVKDICNMKLVGTSLGGFYAAHLAAEFDLPAVLINPAVSPFESLNEPSYKGKDITTLKFKYRPLVLLDMGDEHFDSTVTAKKLSHFEIIKYAGGNHRFAHMNEAAEEIKKYFNMIDTFYMCEDD